MWQTADKRVLPRAMLREHQLWRILQPVLLAWFALASGCSFFDERYAFGQGWRIGEVLKVGSAAELAFAGIDCRRNMPDGGNRDHRFAEIQVDFRQTARKHPHAGATPPRYAIVPVPDSLQIVPGDRVYVNIQDCALAIERFPSSKEVPSSNLNNGLGPP